MKHDNIAQKMLNHIECNLYEVDREFLAKEMKYSSSSVYRIFKGIYGISLKEYITARRLSEAAILLKEKEMSITDIAIKIGYSSNSDFTKAFKKLYKITPKDFRQYGDISSIFVDVTKNREIRNNYKNIIQNLKYKNDKVVRMKSNIKKIRQEFIGGILGMGKKRPIMPVYNIQFDITGDKLYSILNILEKVNDFMLDNSDELYSHSEIIEDILQDIGDVDEAKEHIEFFVNNIVSNAIKYEVPLEILSEELECDDELVNKYVYDSIETIGKRIEMLEKKMIEIPCMILGIPEKEFKDTLK